MERQCLLAAAGFPLQHCCSNDKAAEDTQAESTATGADLTGMVCPMTKIWMRMATACP